MPKIVITGGPCAGKTTLIGILVPELVQRGCRVHVLDECATEVLAQGLNPTTCGSVLAFQRHVFDRQLEKEAALADLPDNVIVLLDRGLMDNAGYLPDDELDMLLAERNMTRADAYARYDAVIHLVTAAIGAETYFSHATNEHRLEGVEEAVRVDRALLRGWSGHPNLRVIDNEGSFEDKLGRAVEAVLAAAGIS
ncbi:MAG: ATP-binding protein [Atopobiaceae bacterium]|nr:ATP-binding protein [Atopobiaceae bacterium]MDO4403529.1 ATP-binding protein [Atopobiaceae bacterium]